MVNNITAKFEGSKIESVFQTVAPAAIAAFNGASDAGNLFVDKFSGAIEKVVSKTAVIADKSLSLVLKTADGIAGAVERRFKFFQENKGYADFIGDQVFNISVGGFEELDLLKAKIFEGIGALSQFGQEFLFLTYGVQQLGQTFSAPFDAFIGQNIRLQETLLQTQSQIVATNKVLESGVELTNATQAIKALGEESEQIIDDIRTGSLALVGTTSQALVGEILPVVSRNIATLGGTLNDIPDLVLSLGASFGTLGIPLQQASQELTSIAQGVITVDSQLAKSLNLTSAQVQLYKAQGRLIPELTARLQPFVEGNALAAQTIGGVTSNLQEVFELLTQKAGATFLDPIVSRLNEIYALVDPVSSVGAKNFQAIQELVSGIAQNIFDGLLRLADGFAVFSSSISKAFIGFAKSGAVIIGEALGSIGFALEAIGKAFSGLFTIIGSLAEKAQALGPLFQLGVFLKLRSVLIELVVGAFGLLAKTLPVVSGIFTIFSLRTNETALALANLNRSTGPAISSLLVLGKNLGSIPGGFQAVQEAIPLFGRSIAQIIPTISQIGIAVSALAAKYPPIAAILANLNVQIPIIINNIARFLISLIQASVRAVDAAAAVGKVAGNFSLLGASFAPAIAGLQKLTQEFTLTGLAMGKLSAGLDVVRSKLVTTILRLGFNLALFAAFTAVFEKIQPVLDGIGKGISGLIDIVGGFGQALLVLGKTPPIAIGAVSAAFLYLAFAIKTQATPAVIAFLQLQLTNWLLGVSSVLVPLTTALLTTSGKFTALAGTIQLIPGVSEKAIAAMASLKAGTVVAAGGFQALAIAIGAALFAATAIVSTVAFVGLRSYNQILADSTEAVEIYGRVSRLVSGQTADILQKESKLRKEQEAATINGIKLTKEQYAENARIQQQIQAQIATEESRKKDLEKALPDQTGAENKRNLEAQIAEAKRNIEELKAASSNIQIAPKDLVRRGSQIEQAARDLKNAEKALREPSGDPDIFKKQVGALIEASTQLQDAGVINADASAKSFLEIATNVKVDKDLQIKAQEAITAAYQKEAQRRVAIYDAQQAKIEALIATGKVSESEGALLSSKNEQSKLNEQAIALEKTLSARKKIIESNAEEQRSQAERDARLAEARVASAKGDPRLLGKVKREELPKIDEDAARVKRQIEEAQTLKKRLESESPVPELRSTATISEIDSITSQIESLEKQLEGISKYRGEIEKIVSVSDASKLDIPKLNSQISVLDKQITESQARLDELNKKRVITRRGGKQISVAIGSAEERAAQESELSRLKADRQKIEAERAKIESAFSPDEKQALLAGKDLQDAKARLTKGEEQRKALTVEAEREINSQLDKIRADQLRKEAEAAIKILDGRIKETLQAEKVGETQRLAQIAQLRKEGVKLESEIKLQETAERKRSIALELQLEQQKQKQIEDLKKKGIGVSDETRNANRIKVAELTKQLAEAELAAIEGLVSAVRDRLTLESQKYAVTIEQQNLKLERQKLLFTALERGLENQNRLSESANKLTQSTITLRESEFNALNKIYDRQQAAIRKAGGEGNFADLELEEKKLIIAEKLAVIKLNALKQQQKFEAESLERDIQKRDLALERKKVENDIAIAKKKIDIASQDAAIKSAELEVKLRPQSEEAKLKLAQARLGQEKNFLELGGLQQEKGFIAQEATVNDLVSNNDRRSLFNQQQSQTNSAIGDVIGATRDDALRERLQQEQLQRLVGTTGRAALTTTDVSNAVAAAGQPINVRGASFKSPNSELLGRVEQGGTFTAAPAAPRDDSFATSFEELARKYPNNGVGSIEELNKKFPSQASSFEELNAKYSGKPEPEQAIVSSFDRLTTQIDEGFAKVLVAPDVKVKDLTLSLEAEFERVSKKISENPAKLTIDDSEIKKLNELVAKPLTVFDDKQLERVESVIVALGKGVAAAGFESFAKGASPSSITINAPTTINEAQQKAGSSREEFKEVFNDILKRTIGVTARTK